MGLGELPHWVWLWGLWGHFDKAQKESVLLLENFVVEMLNRIRSIL